MQIIAVFKFLILNSFNILYRVRNYTKKNTIKIINENFVGFMYF